MSYQQASLVRDEPRSERVWLLDARDSMLATNSAFLPDGFVEHFTGGLDRGSLSFRNHPLHLAGFDLILCDAARFARKGLDHWRRPALQLARTTRRHQNVPVIAVEAVDQLHWILPALLPASRDLPERLQNRFQPLANIAQTVSIGLCIQIRVRSTLAPLAFC